MSAILISALFAAIATFALAAIIDAVRRFGPGAFALHTEVKRMNAGVDGRWIASGASQQPVAVMPRGRPRQAPPAVRCALRAAA